MTTASMVIDGRGVATDDAFDVVDPATERVIGRAPSCRPAQLDDAFEAASRAFDTWREDDGARQAMLAAAADRIDEASEELGQLLTSEQGKPITEARDEVRYAAMWLRYHAHLALPRDILADDENGFTEVRHRPMGVVAAITPWNYPVNLAMWKIAPALRTGNTMVLKPSPYTPLTTLRMAEIMQADLPPGVLNVVTGPDPLGAQMVEHPVPRKISFTGSTAAGRKVFAAAAPTLKRITLELGGNDAAVVLPDADPAAIAESLFWGAFMNNGQVCLAAKRVYVHESQRDALAEAMAAVVSRAPMGIGSDPETKFGPINNRMQYDKVSELVADALARGATAVTGGAPVEGPGWFYPATILTDVDDGVRVVDEEQFGPVLPLVAYRDVEEAVERANRGDFGLTASVWSPDIDRATEVSTRLEVGAVSINQHAGAIGPHLPFAGHRSSGVGVENGIWGLRSYTETQAFVRPPLTAHPTERN